MFPTRVKGSGKTVSLKNLCDFSKQRSTEHSLIGKSIPSFDSPSTLENSGVWTGPIQFYLPPLLYWLSDRRKCLRSLLPPSLLRIGGKRERTKIQTVMVLYSLVLLGLQVKLCPVFSSQSPTFLCVTYRSFQSSSSTLLRFGSLF